MLNKKSLPDGKDIVTLFTLSTYAKVYGLSGIVCQISISGWLRSSGVLYFPENISFDIQVASQISDY